MSRVSIDLRGLPAVRRLLATVDDKERTNRERRAVRAAGNVFKPVLAAAARSRHGSGSGNVPASFSRIRVRVSSSNRRGRQPTAIIKPRSPLFNIFEPGAGAHQIVPGSAGHNSSRPSRPTGTHSHKTGKRALGGPAGQGGWDAVGRKRPGAFFTTKPVRHPGLAARPILPGAFSSGVAPAEAVAIAIIFGRPGAPLGAAE